MERNGEVQTLERQQWNKRTKEIYRYRYVNQIPLRDTQPSLRVNWCELYSPLLRNGLLNPRLHQRYDDVIHFTRAGRLLV